MNSNDAIESLKASYQDYLADLRADDALDVAWSYVEWLEQQVIEREAEIAAAAARE